LRKSTPIFLSALCLSACLSVVSAADAPAAAPSPAPAATVAAPASATPVPAAAPADSAKPAKKAKAKKPKAAKDTAQAVVPAPKDSALTATPVVPAAAAAPVAALAPAVVADTVKAKDSLKTVAGDSAKAPAAPVAAADSAKSPVPDSAKTAPAVATTVDSTAYADSTQPGAKKKRKRVVRETTVNTIDDLKGRYRSPKKALFMSMVIPGLGQAYVGQHWSNYARGGFYFLTDVALAYGWHYYVVDRQDAQIAKYKSFADKNWRQYKYEDVIANDKDAVAGRNQHRESYCETVQDNSTTKGNSLLVGCKTPTSADYDAFKNEYNDKEWNTEENPDSVSVRRAQFPNPHNFYELIGKENEFITGWLDGENIILGDSAYYADDGAGNPLKNAAGRLVLATTPNQQKYIGMRAQANDYARMQAYFLGGMVVNHIVSAIDAGLAAHYHNKALYQTETNWWDRLRLDSQLAWDGYAPTPTVVASFTF
jgi:hypothetical protein